MSETNSNTQTVKISQLEIRQVSKSASGAGQSHLCIIADLGHVARDGVVLFLAASGDSAHNNVGNFNGKVRFRASKDTAHH